MNHQMHEMSQSATFFDYWNPLILLIVVVAGILYMRMVGPWRDSFQDSEPVENWRKGTFLTGLALFYIVQGSPINYIGHHYLFSVHMFQQSVLYLIVPILIIVGLPQWSIAPILKVRWIRAVLRFFTLPLISLFLFNLAFSVYHMPLVMNYLMSHDLALFGYHALLLFSAFMMWYPVFGKDPYLCRMSSLQKMGFIFLNGMLLTPACALIIFASDLLYEMYQGVQISIPNYTLLDDQQAGGVIMKIMQEIIYGVALYKIFRAWYAKERKQEEELLSDEPQEGVTFEPAYAYPQPSPKH